MCGTKSEDQMLAEDAVENAITYLRGDRNTTSPYKREMHRKVLRREMEFLKTEFPDSYVNQLDVSDIANEVD